MYRQEKNIPPEGCKEPRNTLVTADLSKELTVVEVMETEQEPAGIVQVDMVTVHSEL